MPVDKGTVADRVLGALAFAVPKARPPAGYALGLTLLAGGLVLMPVAYGALLAFLTWLTAWHAVQAVRSLGYGPYCVFHVPMALAGAVMATFLVKPVFFRSKGKRAGVVTLTPAEQPLLFAAVERLCAATGARPPSTIEVDCEPNAHARFDRFTDSVRGTGGALVLRIGLPLAAGLSARQLLGVIGHELGHFNQKRGMAGSYLIRRLTAFFAKVVFRRDKIDEGLARLRRKRNGWAKLAYWVTVATVEPMRGLLWLLMVGGELLTCGVLRRMEHDADAVEAHVAGGAEFVRTAKILLFLDIAHRRARSDLANAYAHRRLADDLPRLIVANAKQLREHRKGILKLPDGFKTQWFDTHPCHADRVAHVEQIGAAGLFDVELPASKLFDDFRGLCRRATTAVYDGLLKPEDLAGAQVVPTDDLATERATQRAAAEVLRRYFRGHIVAGRPMFPLAEQLGVPVGDVTAAAGQLAEARQSVEDAGRAGNALASTIRRYAEASTLVPILQAQLTVCSIFRSNPKSASLATKAERGLAQQKPVLVETSAILTSFEQTGRERLTLALRLMNTDAVAAHLGDDVTVGRAGVRQLAGVCAELEAALPVANKLGTLLPALQMLSSAYNPKQPFQPLVRQILASTNEAVKLLKQLQSGLRGVAYPFAHGTAGVTVADHLLPQMPDLRDPQATHAATSAALDRYHELTFRSLSVLTQWAELAEGAVGLPPLEEVPDSADESASDARQSTAAAKRSRQYWIGYGGRAAAGLAMVASLVGLSVRPPTLPFGTTDDGSGGTVRYQPAAFGVSSALPVPASFRSVGTPQGWPPAFNGYQGRTVEVRRGFAPVFNPPQLRGRTFAPPTIPPPRTFAPGGYVPPPVPGRFGQPPNVAQYQPRPFTPNFAPQRGGYPGGGTYRGGGGGRR